MLLLIKKIIDKPLFISYKNYGFIKSQQIRKS